MVLLVGILVWECRCGNIMIRGLALTFDLAVVMLIFKILSGPYLRNCEEKEVDSWMGHWVIECRYAKSSSLI